jgi:hypothetical protein
MEGIVFWVAEQREALGSYSYVWAVLPGSSASQWTLALHRKPWSLCGPKPG